MCRKSKLLRCGNQISMQEDTSLVCRKSKEIQNGDHSNEHMVLIPTIKKNKATKTVQQRTAEETAARKNNGTMGESKCTYHCRPSWYQRCRVISQPHRMKKTSRKRPKRHDLRDYIVTQTIMLLSRNFCKGLNEVYSSLVWFKTLSKLIVIKNKQKQFKHLRKPHLLTLSNARDHMENGAC